MPGLKNQEWWIQEFFYAIPYKFYVHPISTSELYTVMHVNGAMTQTKATLLLWKQGSVCVCACIKVFSVCNANVTVKLHYIHAFTLLHQSISMLWRAGAMHLAPHRCQKSGRGLIGCTKHLWKIYGDAPYPASQVWFVSKIQPRPPTSNTYSIICSSVPNIVITLHRKECTYLL